MFKILFKMDGAKSCRFRTDFVQICVRNISDFCSKSDSNLCNVSSASSPQKLLNCLRALPKMHIGFERKSTRFLSDFDKISVPNLIDFCFKSEPNLNFCEKFGSFENFGVPQNFRFRDRFLSDLYDQISDRFFHDFCFKSDRLFSEFYPESIINIQK